MIKQTIDLSNIKKKPDGEFDWVGSIGQTCDFIYNDIEGSLKIIEVVKGKIKFEYNEKYYWIYRQSFIKAKFGRTIVSTEYKYKIGDIVKNIKITGYVKKTGHKRYYGTCQICNDEGIYFEHSLEKNNVPCHICNNRKVKQGINDISTTDPWMIQYFVNKTDATKYLSGSNKIVPMKCPVCGTQKMVAICRLKEKGGISCECTNPIPLTERFMGDILEQLKIPYIYQATSLTLPWAGKFKYDFYFVHNNETYIIETNGMQHYRKNTHWRNSFKQQYDRDKKKEELARRYIDHYIILDFRYSRINYMKNAVLNSQLPYFLCFKEEDIDWYKNSDMFSKPKIVEHEKKFNKDDLFKKGLLSYILSNEDIRYRTLSKIFKSDFPRLKRVINELIQEGKINKDKIKTRQKKSA